MNAQKTYDMTRKVGILSQYASAKEKIEQSREWVHFDCHTDGVVFYEVARKLMEEGYKVKTVIRDEDYMSYTSVSWRHARMRGDETVKGELSVINETHERGSFAEVTYALGYENLIPGKVYYMSDNENEMECAACTEDDVEDDKEYAACVAEDGVEDTIVI